jgi:hypothetical protein
MFALPETSAEQHPPSSEIGFIMQAKRVRKDFRVMTVGEPRTRGSALGKWQNALHAKTSWCISINLIGPGAKIPSFCLPPRCRLCLTSLG